MDKLTNMTLSSEELVEAIHTKFEQEILDCNCCDIKVDIFGVKENGPLSPTVYDYSRSFSRNSMFPITNVIYVNNNSEFWEKIGCKVFWPILFKKYFLFDNDFFLNFLQLHFFFVFFILISLTLPSSQWRNNFRKESFSPILILLQGMYVSQK